MKILIIGSGDVSNSHLTHFFRLSDIVICCDGGSRYLFEEGIIPHYIIGDLDSSVPEIIKFFENKNVIFKKFNSKKDETDMELSIDFAISLGAKEITILGATGSRLDHTLANINLLIKTADTNVKTFIIDKNNKITITNSNIKITGKKGDLLSLIPLTTKVEGVSTFGLEYPLNDATMYIGKSLGISNVMENETAIISVKNGYLLVIKSLD